MNARIKIFVVGFILFALYIPLLSSAQLLPVTLPPDNGTLGTAINTGGTAQVKTGDLSVNAFSAVLSSYFASRLGVGNTPSLFTTLDVNPVVTVNRNLKNIQSGIIYNGGTPMVNYYGTYISAPTGSGTITNKYALVTESTAGKVGIGTTVPTSALTVAGGVQLGDDTSTCTAANAGTMRWHSSALEICNGTAWASTAAAASCSTGQLCGFGKYVSNSPTQLCQFDNISCTLSSFTESCTASSPAVGGSQCSCSSGYTRETLLDGGSTQTYVGPQMHYDYATGNSYANGVQRYDSTYRIVYSCRKN